VTEILIVQSKIRDMIKAEGCATSQEAVEALSQEIEKMVKKAVVRAKENGRKTVKGQDI
jgi:histone H3/H4